MRLKAILFATALIPSAAMAQYGTRPDTQQQKSEAAATHDSKTGLTVTELSTEQRTSLAVPGENGLLVKKVEPGSPAAAAGIKAGDVITKIDKNDLKAGSDLTGAAPAEKGKKQSVELIRDKKTMTVQLAAMPDKEKAAPDTQMPSDQDTQRTPSGMPTPE